MRIVIALLLAEVLCFSPPYALARNARPADRKQVSAIQAEPDCLTCTGSEFAGKISQTLVQDTVTKLTNLNRKQANFQTLTRSDIRLAASAVHVLFLHLDETKGADGKSYIEHMEKGLRAQHDQIKNHVGSITDAETLRARLAKSGVVVTSSQALSMVQVSPDTRAAGLAYLQARGLHSVRDNLVHQLHLMEKQVQARELQQPRAIFAQFDNSFGIPDSSDTFWNIDYAPAIDSVYSVGGNYDSGSVDLNGVFEGVISALSGDPCRYWIADCNVFGICCLIMGSGVDPLSVPCCVALILATAALVACQIIYPGA